MSQTRIFIPITKIDEEKREVWGTLTQEVADRDGEIIDYDSSKPAFEKWSQYFSDATGGKSLGNLRAMHRNISAGKLIALNFDDANRKIDIGTKIVDDDEWRKVTEGLYTGFSASGDATRRWKDPHDSRLRRYTIGTVKEASLADLPAVPTATFSMVKIGGAVETKHFQRIAERSDTTPGEGESKYGDVTYADEKNKKYPIDTKAHVRAALSYWGQAKNRAKYGAQDQATIGRKIRAAAKKFGIGDASSEKIASGGFQKSLYDLSRLADLVQSLAWLQQCARAERDNEDDGSDIPDRLLVSVEDLSGILRDMTGEELDELAESLKAEKVAGAARPRVTTSTLLGDRQMPNDNNKFEKRFGKAHMAKLGGIHEHAQIVHKLFGDHVDNLDGTEHHEHAKAIHKLLGHHVAKIADFIEEVGGLPETSTVGSESGAKGRVESEDGGGDKTAGSRKDGEGTAAFEKRFTDLEARVAEAEKARKDAEAKAADFEKIAGELQEQVEGFLKLAGGMKGDKQAPALRSVPKTADGEAPAAGAGKVEKTAGAKEEGKAADEPKSFRDSMRGSFAKPQTVGAVGAE